MKSNTPTNDELIAKCDDLQGQVIRFLKVEQDLIQTRHQLDRDLGRFKAIQSYSQRIIQAESMEEFAEITVESVIETFEVECSAFFSYDKDENCLKVKGMFGFEANHLDCQLDSAWMASMGISQEGNVIIENVSPDSDAMGSMGLHQVIISPYHDENKNLNGILIGGVSVSKKGYYDKISEELIPSFMVFTQQMSSLLQNFEAKRYLNEKVQQRTAEVVKQKLEIEDKNEVLEQQKQELQITLNNLKKTQNQLIQSEKLAALGKLVAGVAHEINTPVGISVTAASNLIDETKQMADFYKNDKISRHNFKDYLKSANQSAKLILANMERTATMIQSFKQISTDQSTEEKRIFRLRAYLEDVIRSLYPKLKDKRVQINLEVDKKIEINSYPGPFSQIFTNLILNSLEHGLVSDRKEKLQINITAGIKDKELSLEYRDDGKGIPEDILPKIFDPFFTTNKIIGTGLGLHIIYNLVTQKLMGSISCTSENEKGVHFTMKIPVHQ